jgi:hypothetical protein
MMRAKLVNENLIPINEYSSAETNILKGKKEVPIRVYYWADANMGWGDAGTKFYAVVPVEAFEVKIHTRDDKSKYYEFQLTDEWWKKLKMNMGCGWELDIGDKKRKEEIKEAEEILKVIKEVKRF